MTTNDPPLRRSDYRVWRSATTRWADDDVYGHMNNAAYFELIDTCVNAYLIQATGLDIRSLPAIGVVAEVSCRYFYEIGFPGEVEMGLAAQRVGKSSVIYRVGLFQAPAVGSAREQDPQLACAEGRFVHVYVENTRSTAGGSRQTLAIPEPIRAAATALLVGA